MNKKLSAEELEARGFRHAADSKRRRFHNEVPLDHGIYHFNSRLKGQ